MWTVISLIVILVFSGSCLAENNGGCKIDEISDTEWRTTKRLAIDDTQINTQVFVSAYNGSLEFKQLQNNGNPYVVGDISSYFNFNYNSTHIYLETTEEFANLDQQTFTNGAISLSIGLTLTLTCSSGDSSVILRLSITDINSNSPVFSSPEYSYNVPTPVMPLTDFSVYGDIISSTDIDFSNTAVTYSIVPDDFQITSTVVNNKTYVASFQARNTLVLTETKEYTLTATDNGNPELSNSAKITLLVDTSQSLDIPSFSKSYYTFIYTGDDTKPVLNLTNGPITAITQKNDTEITNIVLGGDYREYFDVHLSDLTFTLSVSNVPSTLGSSVLLTLSYTTDATATCVLIINTDDSATLTFSSSYYRGTYNISTNKVDLETDIDITSSTSVAVSISGDYSKYFSISDNYLISVHDLPSTVLETESSIVLTLTAKSNAQTSSAVLIVNLPRTTNNTTFIAFNSALYSGEYTVEDGKGKLNLRDDIKIDTNVEDADIDVSISSADGYDKYFSISHAAKIISILPNGIIPDNILQEVSVLSLKITAIAKSTSLSTFAVLNILIYYDEDDDSSTDKDGVVVSEDSHKVAYIVSIVVLAVLLLGIIILTILLWYFKIRNRNYENMEEDEYGAKPSFSKNSVKTTDKNSSNTIEKRRPTGFIFKPLGEDIDEDATQGSDENPHDHYAEEPEHKARERKKSVVFDDNVETMQIDKVDDDDSDIDSVENGGRQINLNDDVHVDEVKKYVDDGDNINENHKDVCSENGEQKHL